MNIEGIQYLFPSWGELKEGEEVYWAMDDGYAWVEQVSATVRDLMAAHPGIDPQQPHLPRGKRDWVAPGGSKPDGDPDDRRERPESIELTVGCLQPVSLHQE